MAKNPWGRPTKYNEEMCQKVDEYIAATKDEYEKILKQSNSSKGYETYDERLKVNLPTHYWLSEFLWVAKSTIYKRAEEHTEFSDSLGKVKEEQKRRLLEMWLSGEYNSTIAKLVLSANHWLSETKKLEQDIKLDATVDVSGMTLKQLEDQRKKLLW